MPGKQPKVSIGVPVYNGEEYLELTLRALKEQSLPDIEVIISDNGSTDRTREICESFAGEDVRFTYLRSETNRGIPWNFNRVLEHASAPLFMWNAADDFVRPHHLAACRNALLANPEAMAAFSRVDIIGPNGESIGAFDDEGLDFLTPRPGARVDLFMRRQVYQVIGYGGVLRTADIKTLGGLPPYFGSDVALGIRMALRSPWVQVPEALYVSRRHEHQVNKSQGGDIGDQIRTHNPSFKRRFGFPQWYLIVQLLRATLASQAPPVDHLMAVRSVFRWWIIRNWRLVAFDLKRNAMHIIHAHRAHSEPENLPALH